jgi:hypothetical protein
MENDPNPSADATKEEPSAEHVAAPLECKTGPREIVASVTWALRRVLMGRSDGMPIKGGGVFCFLDPKTGVTQHETVGMPLPDKTTEMSLRAAQNADELARHAPRPTSWLIRVQSGCTGGAVSTDMGILSFSGLGDELADEAVALLAAVNLGWITDFRASQLANCSDNRAYYRTRSRSL